MGRQFHTEALSKDQVDPSYPLVRIAFPDLTLPAWRRVATFYLTCASDHPGGVLIARNERGTIVGLSLWHLVDMLDGGPILQIEELITADLLGEADIRRALLAGLALRARQLRCTTFLVRGSPHPADRVPAAARRLRALEDENTRLRKLLARARRAGAARKDARPRP